MNESVVWRWFLKKIKYIDTHLSLYMDRQFITLNRTKWSAFKSFGLMTEINVMFTRYKTLILKQYEVSVDWYCMSCITLSKKIINC